MGVEEARQGREDLERAVLPLASSVDGREFAFQASLYELTSRPGATSSWNVRVHKKIGQVLTLRAETASAADLGLTTSVSTARIRLARGEGVILDGDLEPFHDHHARAAEPEEVAAWLQRVRPNRSTLAIGDLLLAPGVPATLDAGGFNRHTFVAVDLARRRPSLGLVLKQLLETSLRMVILDPNSDYVRLGEARAAVDSATAESYTRAASSVAVWQNAPEASHPLRLQLIDRTPLRRRRFSAWIRSETGRSMPPCRASSPSRRKAEP